MHANMRTVISLLLAAVLLVVSTVWTTGGIASASFGNTGMPVRCRVLLPAAEAPTNKDLECFTADGTAFSRIPTNRYLLVTDVLISTLHAPTTNPIGLDIRIFGPSSTSACGASKDSLSFRTNPEATHTTHFNTPYLIAGPGECLQAFRWGANSAQLQLSGLLVTNLTYLPTVAR